MKLLLLTSMVLLFTACGEEGNSTPADTTAPDNSNNTITEARTVNILPVPNTAPVADSEDGQKVDTGALVILESNASDADNDTYTIESKLKDCNTGDADACKILGSMYDEGISVKKDHFEANKFFRKGCDGGNASACDNLAFAYRFGKGVVQEDFQAVKFYYKACDGGLADGCNSLGLMYSYGEGVRKNTLKAKEFFAKACDGGNAEGCKNYAELNKQKPKNEE